MIRRMPILVSSAAALSMLVAVSSVAPAGSSTEEGLQAGTTSGTADCESVTTCYTPQQLEVAYGVQPLLQRGIDGRGETMVLPELAESQLSPPRVSDLRRTSSPSTIYSTCRRRPSSYKHISPPGASLVRLRRGGLGR